MERFSCQTPDRGEDDLAGSLEPSPIGLEPMAPRWATAHLIELKSFGERIASWDPDRQTAEIQIRIAPMNRFKDLGTTEIERIA